MNLIIVGAKGRMGQMINAAAVADPDVAIYAENDIGDDLSDHIGGCDVVVDFSAPDATAGVAKLCAEHKRPLVIGTTGHTQEQKERIYPFTAEIPVVWTTNCSTGVNVLFWLTKKAAQILGPDYDLEVVEMHHRLKKDAPSGTAKTLAEILTEVRTSQLGEVTVTHGREGITGVRSIKEIGMHSLRGGDVAGDHTVIFAGNGERVELVHKATSRETFAKGAIRAAKWIVGKKPGLYSMMDVLELQ